jgi:hypothetical protein
MSPLPVDHRLLILVQYNVLRAIQANVSILYSHKLTNLECSSCRGTMPLFSTPSNLPLSLLPTALQMTVPHKLWIDLMPCPIMRDNAVKLQDTFDNDELCLDMVGGLHGGYDHPGVEKNGMLVWFDPWDVRGWELTEGFVKKWGFLIKGCREAVEATNMWRSRRTEEPLVVELS